MNAPMSGGSYPAPEVGGALIGLPHLMRMALNGGDLAALARNLQSHLQRHPNSAHALMDLSTVLQLQWQAAPALAIQAHALALQRIYRQAAAHASSVKLLALMGPGELMANAPLAFLLEDSDITLDMLYLTPGQELAGIVPEHDVLYIAVSECDQNRALLTHIAQQTQSWPRPVLNSAQCILALNRDSVSALLAGIPGTVAPATVRSDRTHLEHIAHDRLALTSLLPDCAFPIIVRPVDSHAGRGLSKLDTAHDLRSYLYTRLETEFYVSPFIDYRSPDGMFRKYRVALIGGRAYACHMGISTNWMIHYLNAGMMHSAEKRREEAAFMETFDEVFLSRHGSALSIIAQRLGLDYVVLDCAETAQGSLLVFEADPSAVVHAMDSPELFPYKQEPMRQVFAAFRALLVNAMAGDAAV